MSSCVFFRFLYPNGSYVPGLGEAHLSMAIRNDTNRPNISPLLNVFPVYRYAPAVMIVLENTGLKQNKVEQQHPPPKKTKKLRLPIHCSKDNEVLTFNKGCFHIKSVSRWIVNNTSDRYPIFPNMTKLQSNTFLLFFLFSFSF